MKYADLLRAMRDAGDVTVRARRQTDDGVNVAIVHKTRNAQQIEALAQAGADCDALATLATVAPKARATVTNDAGDKTLGKLRLSDAATLSQIQDSDSTDSE